MRCRSGGGRSSDRYRTESRQQADLLRRVGRLDDAARAYRSALDLTAGDAERAFLARRIAEVSASAPGGG
jgi:RNA polymerase sigma-70 factor, ECF subfamily